MATEKKILEGKKGSKTVTFFQNGDRYFKGQVMVITPKRFGNLDVLLSELSRMTNLPSGVRFLLALEDGTHVQRLEELEDGKAYVCSSSNKLKKLNYGGNSNLPSCGSKSKLDLTLDSELRPKKERSKNRMETNTESRATFKSKIVTCIRNGHKPRATARVLLNKRTARNLEQVLNQVSDTLGTSGSTSNIRKLYTTKGQRILLVQELFLEGNDIFIAVGNEKFKPSDIEEIVEDLRRSKYVNMKSRDPGMHRQSKPHRDPKGKNSKHRKKSVELVKEEEKGVHLPQLVKTRNAGAINNSSVARDTKRFPVKPSSPRQRGVNKQTKQTKQSFSGNVKLPPIANSSNLVEKQQNETPEEKLSLTQTKKANRKTVAVLKESNTKSTRAKDEVINISASHGENDRKKQKLGNNLRNIQHDAIPEDNEVVSVKLQNEYCTITDKRAEDVYDIGRKLGDGNFAVVRECFHKITKKPYALKIIDKKKIKGKEAMLQDEINIMRRCRHPNIVRLYEDYDTATENYLTMELVDGGDLFDAISSSVKFTEKIASSYLSDIAKALHYLHSHNIVHRDLKPENLLLHRKSNGHVNLKLADFGLAMEVNAPIFTICGTPTYVAPEILEESGYGLKVDTWAAGVITYIMLCGFPPFRSSNRDQEELFDLIQDGEFEFLSPYWDQISDGAKDLVSNLLVVRVSQRYTAEQVLMHPWVRKKSATIMEISQGLLADSQRPTFGRPRRFKAAALAIQGAKRFENLAEQFQRQRGEKVIIT